MRMRRLILSAALALCALPAVAAGGLSGKWRIVAVGGAEGLDAARARAEFAPNGRFASTVGCNRIAGMPKVSGDKLTFGPMMATRMACPPPLDTVEHQYLAALEAVRAYRLDGKTLVFLGDGGEALVTLEKEASPGRR
jgi:heat shock protein HslJ